MPGVSKKAEELSRPEATPEDVGRIHNGVSVSLEDEADMFTEETETDENSCYTPSANKNLLEQIFAIEANE